MDCVSDIQVDELSQNCLRSSAILNSGGSTEGDWGYAAAEKAIEIFLNTSENKSSDRKVYLIPFLSSVYYVE